MTDFKTNPDLSIRETLQHYGIGVVHLDAKMTDFNPVLADQIIKDLQASVGPFAFGGPGTGKSHLLVAIFRLVLGWIFGKKGQWSSVLFRQESDIFLNLHQAMSPGSGSSEFEIINELSRPQVLLLDDFCSQKITDYYVQTIGTVIDRRWREKKITCISSNHPLSEIASRLDDRIASRVYAMCRTVRFDGMDWRLK